jgi:hypothetical protein
MVPLESASESYLVRIYRRDPRDPEGVAGLVEIIEQERTETFKNAGELMRLLRIGNGNTGGTPAKMESEAAG